MGSGSPMRRSRPATDRPSDEPDQRVRFTSARRRATDSPWGSGRCGRWTATTANSYASTRVLAELSRVSRRPLSATRVRLLSAPVEYGSSANTEAFDVDSLTGSIQTPTGSLLEFSFERIGRRGGPIRLGLGDDGHRLDGRASRSLRRQGGRDDPSPWRAAIPRDRPGAVWVLNQTDGSVSRIEPTTNQTTTIPVHVPGSGGCIAAGEGGVWGHNARNRSSSIHPKTSAVVEQFTGVGGDCITTGFGSVWLSNDDLLDVCAGP